MTLPLRPPLWAIAVVLVSGVLIAIQSRINSALAVEIGDPIVASLVSFSGGTIALAIIVAISHQRRRAFASYTRDLATGRFPWYHAIGGLMGAFFIFTQSFVVATIGVALFVVASVAGQTIAGLVMDRVGFGSGTPRAVSLRRVGGAGLMVLAVILAVSAGFSRGVPLALLIMLLIVGFGVAYQTAVNGIVTRHTGEYLVSAFASFLLGAIGLAIGALVSILVRGAPESWPASPLLYIGGLLGLFVISINAALVKHLGVLVLSMSAIAGQVVGSVILDAAEPGVRLGPLALAGAALTLIAAVVTAGVGARRRGLRPPDAGSLTSGGKEPRS